jgi:Resolvase, N terminal domain
MSRLQRAAIYCRVSTEQQVDGTSLMSQQSQCVEFAAAADWPVTAVLVDEGVSGATAACPALDKLLALCDQRAIEVVVVAKLDRLGWSLRHLAAIIGRIDHVGASLVSETDGRLTLVWNRRLGWWKHLGKRTKPRNLIVRAANVRGGHACRIRPQAEARHSHQTAA